MSREFDGSLPDCFQCDNLQEDPTSACSDVFLISSVMRDLTTTPVLPDQSAQHILSLPESFCRSVTPPPTPSRPVDVFPSSPCLQHLYCLYSLTYTGPCLDHQLSTSLTPSKVLPLPGCGLSPQINAAEGMPFDHHFNLTQSWNNCSSDISPIARKTSDWSTTCSPHAAKIPCCFPIPRMPMDKPSNPLTFQTFLPDQTSSPVMYANELSCSPVSSLSALSSIPSPEHPTTDVLPDGLSCASPMLLPISEWSPTTDRYFNVRHALASTSRDSRGTSTHLRCRKRPLSENDDEELPSRRAKRTHGVGTALVDLTSQVLEAHSSIPSQRRLPLEVSRHPEFSLFYQRYSISSFIKHDDEVVFPFSFCRHPGGIYNSPRDPRDLYTPRFVKGKGRTKVGLCPICFESPSRGGRGQKVWLSMKFSAFNYHMQFAHGVSAMTGRPFSPPVSYRTTLRRRPLKTERSEIIEGMCHTCRKWVPIESIKDCVVKVKELFWWKHAATCHRGSQIPGDDDFYEEDDVSCRLEELGL